MKYLITCGGRIEDMASAEDEALDVAEDVAKANPQLEVIVWTRSSTFLPK